MPKTRKPRGRAGLSLRSGTLTSTTQERGSSSRGGRGTPSRGNSSTAQGRGTSTRGNPSTNRGRGQSVTTRGRGGTSTSTRSQAPTNERRVTIQPPPEPGLPGDMSMDQLLSLIRSEIERSSGEYTEEQPEEESTQIPVDPQQPGHDMYEYVCYYTCEL